MSVNERSSDSEIIKEFRGVSRTRIIRELLSRREVGGYLSNICFNVAQENDSRLGWNARTFYRQWDDIPKCDRGKPD